MSNGRLSGVAGRIITFSKRVFGATAVVVGGILGYQALAVMGTAPLIAIINIVIGVLSALLGAGVLYPSIASVWRAEPFSQLERDAMLIATIGVWVLSELAVQALT